MYTPIKRLSRVNATLQAALAAGHRVLDVLDRHDEVPEAKDAVVLPRMRRGHRVPAGRLPLRGRPRGGPARRQLRRAARRGGGDRGHERLRQDDARQPAPALLRRDRRRDPHRRGGRAAGHPGEPARPDRPRDAGDGALQRHRAREHRLRDGRRGRGPRGVGRPGRLRPRLHPRPAAPLRHRDRGAGEPPLRRAEAAHRDRPGHPEGPPDPDPRRGDLGPRRRVGAAGAGRPREPHARADHPRDRAPADHRARRGPHRGPRRGRGAARRAGTRTCCGSPAGSTPACTSCSSRRRRRPYDPLDDRLRLREPGDGGPARHGRPCAA